MPAGAAFVYGAPMRSVLVLFLISALVGIARADGPEEPRATPENGAAAQPAPAAQAAPAPAPAAVAAPAPKKDDEEIVPNPSKKWGFAFLGLAGGAFVLAAATGGAGAAIASGQQGNVASPQPYTKDLQSQAATGQALSTAAYAFIGIGAAFAIIDAVVWFECLRAPKRVKKSVATIDFTPAGVRF